MAEGRMLKKKISKSRRVNALSSDSARLLYTWLIPHLDIEGRFSADPDVVKGEIFPRLKHFTASIIEKLLYELADKELIVLYQNDGDRYLELRKFADEQWLRKDKEKASEIAAPGESELISGIAPVQSPPKAGTPPDEEKIREEKIIKDMRISSAAPALLFPLKDGSEYPLELAKISQYEKTYHNIDVQFELKKCLQWDIDRPKERKAKTGILKHINFWLNRASKDKGPPIQKGIEKDNKAVEEARKDKEDYDPIKARERLTKLALMVGKDV